MGMVPPELLARQGASSITVEQECSVPSRHRVAVSPKVSSPRSGRPMASLTCSECRGKVSDTALANPHCGTVPGEVDYISAWERKSKVDIRGRLIMAQCITLVFTGALGVSVNTRTDERSAKERAQAAEAIMQATSYGNIRTETTKKENEK